MQSVSTSPCSNSPSQSCPSVAQVGGGEGAKVRAGQTMSMLRDPVLAETYGREILGLNPWPAMVFDCVDDCDGSSRGYLLPAEFAMLVGRLQVELGEVPRGRHFSFHFSDADANGDGRVSIQEWDGFAAAMEHAFGSRRCKRAAMRLLGARKAEHRILKNNVYVFTDYNHEASLALIRSCAKWSNPHLFRSVHRALERTADPNCALANPAFNGYTPLIFLAMAQPVAISGEVARAIDTLIAAKADVHRESDKMPFGKWPPLRFAAQLQNRAGVAALLPHVDVGEHFSWAAKEAVEYVMLDEIEKVCGHTMCRKITKLDRYSNQATVLMQLFASNIVGGDLSPEGAEKLIKGTYKVWSMPMGCKADPNGAGLDGMTALMYVILKGDTKVVEVLLENTAAPDQRDSRGLTPLHFAAMVLNPGIVRVLLEARAEPHSVDHAGFSAWMLVGEYMKDFVGADERARLQEILDIMRPESSAERIIKALEDGTWEQELLGPEGADLKVMKRRWRLHESLFFDSRLVRRGSYQGRFVRNTLLKRVATVLLDLLQIDPLTGNKKELTKYLLSATIGPRDENGLDHIKVPWAEADNRSLYREQLTETIGSMLAHYGAECDVLKEQIRTAAADDPDGTCAAFLALPHDVVEIPEAWQLKDPFWRVVQERQILRYDPAWSRTITNGVTSCIALLRLRAITDLAQYCYLQQVQHATMQEMLARGYVAFSENCNEGFQHRVREIASRVAQREGIDVRPPKDLVKAKALKRLLEKTREAREEYGDMQWPGLSAERRGFSHCFHILDTVRTSFICEGASIEEQVDCCMKLLNEFRACTVEADGICVLRQKSGFSQGATAKGGYADVKLLIYADLGSCPAFDGTEVLLQIVGEVQLILRGFMNVKSRMHLVYEVDRGSYDCK